MPTLRLTPDSLAFRPADSGRTSPVRRADLWHALAMLFVPGTAGDDVVPAIHAADAQALLVAIGMVPAAATSGRWDGLTVEAVRCFQRSRGLPVTGVADHRTADALLVAADRCASAMAA